MFNVKKTYLIGKEKKTRMDDEPKTVTKRHTIQLDNAKLWLESANISPGNLSFVRYMISRANGNVVKCKYELKSGRYVSAIQNLRSDIRASLFGEQYVDVDFVMSHLTIMRQLLKKHDMDCTQLESFCESSPSKPEKKRAVAIMNGSALVQSDTTAMILLHAEFKQNRKQLKKTFPAIVNELEYANKNVNSCLLSVVAMKIERQCLLALDRHLKQQGFLIGMWIHDGLHVDKAKKFTLEAQKLAEAAIQTATGYHIKLAIKPMDMNQEITDTMNTKYKPMEKITVATNPMIVFSPAKVDRRNIRFLKKKGYRIAVWTHESLNKLPLAEWRKWDFEPEFVLGPRNCQRTDKKTKCVKSPYDWFDMDSLDNRKVFFIDNPDLFDSRYKKLVFGDTKMVRFDATPIKPKHVKIDKSGMRTKAGSNDKSINPIVFPGDTKCVVIAAGLNAGKSYACKEHVASGKYKRILVVTCRIQHAMSSKASLNEQKRIDNLKSDGFELYSDVLAEKRPISKCDRLIIQFESLHHLNGAQFDLIIIDEIRSVLNQCVSTVTNKGNLMLNNSILQNLLKSTKSILLDAHCFIDPMLIDYLNLVVPDNYFIYEYTYNTLKRDYVFVDSDNVGFCDRMMTQIKRGDRLLLLFRSKTEMRNIMEYIKSIVEDCKILSFDGDSTVEHMEFFTNINSVMTDYQLCCFTSKVTVSADIQVPFDGVYVFAITRGCSYRDVAQMIGRARQLRGKVFILHGAQTSTPTIDDMTEFLKVSKQLRADYGVLLTSTLDKEGRIFVDWLDPVTTCLLVHQQVEQRGCFLTNMIRLCEATGVVEFIQQKQQLTVEEQEIQGETQLKMDIAADLAGVKTMDKWRDSLTRIKTLDRWPYDEVAKRLNTKLELPTDKIDGYVMRAAGHFTDDTFRNNLDANTIKAISDYKNKCIRAKLASLSDLERMQFDHIDIAKSTGSAANVHQVMGEGVTKTIEMCKLIGFEKLPDFDKWICKTVIDNLDAKITELYNYITNISHNGTKTWGEPKNMVKGVLEKMGLTLKSKRITVDGKRGSTVYQMKWMRLSKRHEYGDVEIGDFIDKFNIKTKMLEKEIDPSGSMFDGCVQYNGMVVSTEADQIKNANELTTKKRQLEPGIQQGVKRKKIEK